MHRRSSSLPAAESDAGQESQAARSGSQSLVREGNVSVTADDGKDWQMHIQELKYQASRELPVTGGNEGPECNGWPTGSEKNVVPAEALHEQQPDDESQPCDRSQKLAADLQRLRHHLISVEDGYTQELLLAEDREKQLRTRLAHCEQQIEHLEQQLRKNVARDGLQDQQQHLQAARRERDQALAEVSVLEDKIHQISATNERLQLVLEQTRRDWQEKLQESQKRVLAERMRSEELEQRLKWQEKRFAESAEALGAAGRLADQIDQKQCQIHNLKEEVAIREKEVEMVRKELETVKSAQEGKVDKQLAKSVVLGYLCAAPHQKHEVERLLALILDFNQQEIDRAKLRFQSKSSSWQPPQPAADASLASLFVRFLESESSASLSQNSQPVRQLAHSLLTSRPYDSDRGLDSSLATRSDSSRTARPDI